MTQTLTRTPDDKVEAGIAPFMIRFEPAIALTKEQFEEFCAQNRDARIELTEDGVIEIMPPTKGDTGSKELGVGADLQNWARADSSGVAFGASAGFTLPNGAVRSPDASWILKSRLSTLTVDEKTASCLCVPISL